MAEPKRGRPRLVEDDTTTAVNVRVPTKDYDRACSIARRETQAAGRSVSVADVVRRGLKRVVDDEDED